MSAELCVPTFDPDVLKDFALKFPDQQTTSLEGEIKYPLNLIPFILYYQMSHNLGIGDEQTIKHNELKEYRIKLNPNLEVTGFVGAIGIEDRGYGQFTFKLWQYASKMNEEYPESRPTLEITGGPYNISGEGSIIYNSLWMHLDDFMGFPLAPNCTKLIALTMYAANGLAADPKFEWKKQWRHDFYKAYQNTQ